jgi:hypothetical protein
MEQSNVSRAPAVQPPRREGISKRAILIIAILAIIFYVANWISTHPLTRRPRFVTPTQPALHRPAPPAAGAPAEAAAAGRWCTDYGGILERFSSFIEICHFYHIVNSSSSSSKKRLKRNSVGFGEFSKGREAARQVWKTRYHSKILPTGRVFHTCGKLASEAVGI